MSRLRRREARNVSIDFLEPHPDNIRKELGPTEDLDELGASMRSQGVLQALLVTPHPAEDGVFIVIDGHRRLAAARRAHVFDLPCIVTEPGATPGQVLTAMVAADIRRPLAPIGPGQSATGATPAPMSVHDALRVLAEHSTKVGVHPDDLREHWAVYGAAARAARRATHPDLGGNTVAWTRVSAAIDATRHLHPGVTL